MSARTASDATACAAAGDNNTLTANIRHTVVVPRHTAVVHNVDHIVADHIVVDRWIVLIVRDCIPHDRKMIVTVHEPHSIRRLSTS